MPLNLPWSLDELRASDYFVISDCEGNVACLVPGASGDGSEAELEQLEFVEALIRLVNAHRAADQV